MASERDGCDQTKILTRRHEYGEAARNAGERGPPKSSGPAKRGPEVRGRKASNFLGMRAYSSVG